MNYHWFIVAIALSIKLNLLTNELDSSRFRVCFAILHVRGQKNVRTRGSRGNPVRRIGGNADANDFLQVVRQIYDVARAGRN